MSKDSKESIPCYAGRDKCGCMVSCIVDDANDPPTTRKAWLKEIKQFMADCLKHGLTIERTTVGEVRKNFGHKCGKERPAK